MCFATGEESGRVGVRKDIAAGAFNPKAASSTSSHIGEIVNSIDSFFSCDYATVMKLGSLDTGGLRKLYAYDDNGAAGTNSVVKISGLDGGMK
ncbi:unnamed protein product [Lactuca virosa]|uniref:Uncharacterized protein n=1 Tax=Lactuca virosa TaxID=75947 RepID=A0AAU9M5U2_9ASTR|nr:unnamed protein product [Lactuca virosa]